MKLDIIWNEQKYQEYIEYLKSIREEEYKKFSLKTITTKYEMLGIRLPIQRKIAKEILKGDIISFLNISNSTYYEEVMIKCLVLANVKEKKVFLTYIEDYVSLIDNWAICDSFCNSLKIINTDKKFWFNYFSDYTKKQAEFFIRVGLITFLNHYVEEEYLDSIFQIIDTITLDKYYVNMAIAWLLCECFIKCREKTLNYFIKSKINTFTFNKTISKIRDSYRVSQEDKEFLASLKRK